MTLKSRARPPGRVAGFERWADGYGPIRHEAATQRRAREAAAALVRAGAAASTDDVFAVLAAADRVACAAMRLVAHMSYARRVRADGGPLGPEDFKAKPEGHMGGALNMVPAYAGYLAANALSGITRSWVMGQGHCVAAIDAVNLLVGNLEDAQARRYDVSEEGQGRFVSDFYSYGARSDGLPASPLGSHVGPHTAGGLMEGGYLGFAELYYPHMPLPGESLVAFLSDGAFEEQRGGDWAARWWRLEDCGLIVPVMIANGRRIDQRTTAAQQGGASWLRDHLRLNGLDPFDVDGRDPAAYAWAILEAEDRLAARGRDAAAGRARYPAAVPYALAEAPKGFGFPNAGTNLAHNLPLGEDVSGPETRRLFNEGAARLYVPPEELAEAVRILNNHAASGRPREKDHPLARRRVPPLSLPEPAWKPEGERASPMAAVDDYFCRVVRANPALRPRVGNPDEMSSNRLEKTLELLKHRVTAPEPGVPEAVHGAVITALNEEAVCAAALANKGGLNLVASYEAFAVKMLGALRQELTFSRRLREAGRPPGWLSVPVLLTSHTWENGKNEQSHQDPALCEALLGEMSDVARVMFPPDANAAAAALRACFRSRGEIWALVTPKRTGRAVFSAEAAEALVADGAARLRGDGRAQVLLAAVGAYQLEHALRASDRLAARGVSHAVVCVLEPGRFRAPRDAREEAALAPPSAKALFPPETSVRVFLGHTRPETLAGVLSPLSPGPDTTRFLGYINRGGTLDVRGMLFANRCTWAHAVAAVEDMFGREELLDRRERDAVEGRSADPLADLDL
jgi:phosphoketolase